MAASQKLDIWVVQVMKIAHLFCIATALAAGTLMFGLISGIACASEYPAAGTIYTVSGVSVDATGKNAVEAREKALAQGQREAFQRLLDRLVSPGAGGPPALQPSQKELTDMVLGVAIEGEKASAVRYIAELTVRFRPDAVRAVLNGSGVSFSDVPAPLSVVIPLFRPAPSVSPVLWEDPNPWREAWNQASGERGLVPLAIPMGDLADVSAMDAARALAQDEEALDAFAKRYNAASALVLEAESIIAPDTSFGPGVQIRAFRSGLASETFSLTIDPASGVTSEEVFARAVSSVEAYLEQSWRQRVDAVGGGMGKMVALVLLEKGVQDWQSIYRSLNASPYVRSWRLQALTRSQAQIEIDHLGADWQFAAVMEQMGLSIAQEGDIWVIRQAAATFYDRPYEALPGEEGFPFISVP